MNAYISVLRHQGTDKEKRGHQKDREGETPPLPYISLSSPAPTSPPPRPPPLISFRPGYGRTFLRNLRVDDSPSLWHPLLGPNLKSKVAALAGVAQRVGHHPVHQKAGG